MDKESNPLYYEIVKQFGDATGTPVTSPLTFGGFGADRVFTSDTLCNF